MYLPQYTALPICRRWFYLVPRGFSPNKHRILCVRSKAVCGDREENEIVHFETASTTNYARSIIPTGVHPFLPGQCHGTLLSVRAPLRTSLGKPLISVAQIFRSQTSRRDKKKGNTRQECPHSSLGIQPQTIIGTAEPIADKK